MAFIADKIEEILRARPKPQMDDSDYWQSLQSLMQELEDGWDLTEREKELLDDADVADTLDKRCRALSYLATLLRDRLPGPDGVPGRFRRHK